MKVLAYFFIGMFVGGIILFASIKSARSRFDETIESDESEWQAIEEQNEKNEIESEDKE